MIEEYGSNEELRRRGINTRELLGLLAVDDKAGELSLKDIYAVSYTCVRTNAKVY